LHNAQRQVITIVNMSEQLLGNLNAIRVDEIRNYIHSGSEKLLLKQ